MSQHHRQQDRALFIPTCYIVPSALWDGHSVRLTLELHYDGVAVLPVEGNQGEGGHVMLDGGHDRGDQAACNKHINHPHIL